MPTLTNPARPALGRQTLLLCLAASAALLLASRPATAQPPTCAPPPDLAAQLTQQPGPESYAALADWFGRRQQYDCAAGVLHQGLAATPASAPLLYLLAVNLFAAGHPEDALAPARQAAQLAPSRLAPHLLLATLLQALGQLQQAADEWNTAYALDPASPAVLDGLSRVRIDAGDPVSAIDLLQSAPHDALVSNEDLALDLARAYGRARMLDQAAALLTEAVHRAPDSLRLLDGLETVMVLQTRYQAASDLAAAFVQQHPHDLEAQRLYLRLLVVNHNLDAARPLARQLLANSPHDFDFLYLSGMIERDAGDYPAARDHLREAVALNPNDGSARYNLGAALVALKDPAAAREQLEKAIALGYAAPEARFAYAKALRTLGETDLARQQLALYQQALKQQEARATAASKAAQAAQEMANPAGDPAKAAALYREALAATPDDTQLAYQLSLALARANDRPAQEAALTQAVAGDPTFALAQHQLGLLLMQRGANPEAEAHLRLAVQSAPGYVSGWVSLAQVLAAQKHTAEARQAVATALRLDPQNAPALQVEKSLAASSPGPP